MLLGPVAVVAAMDKATSDMGAPDLAINSAGMMRNGEFTTLTEVLRVEQKLKGIDVSVVYPGEISTPLLDYERAHGGRIPDTVNAFAGVLPVDEAVAGILKGIRKRKYMITPGFRAKLTRFLARKATGFMHRMVDQKVAKAYAKEQQHKAV